MNHISRLTKVLLLAAALVSASAELIAQAILPTSWDFDAATPVGWSESLNAGNTRYANGFAGQACRLDNTTDLVLVQFAEEPGAVSYYMKGQNSGGDFQGTFTIEESADGVTFTPLRTLTNAQLPSAAFTLFTDTPSASTRYIRWYFTNKVSGHNAALDNASIAAPVAGNAQEINVVQATANVPSGSTFITGTQAAVVFTVQNIGLENDLTINGYSISGPDAADFSIAETGTVVPASGTANFTLNFAGTGSGSRFCTVAIDNDDASENPYLINIYAIAGSGASEPANQAGNITFSGVQSWDYNVAFTAGASGADGYVVVRSTGAALSSTPTDNVTYVRGEWIGNGQVVYVGPAASFNARFVEADTDYTYTIFAYNGPANYENYKQDNPTVASVSSSAPNAGSYYNGLSTASANFVPELTAKLFPTDYFQVFYSNYISTLINEFYVRDTTTADNVSASFIECEYSGFDWVYPSTFQFWSGSGDGLSREHCYPQSWMPTFLDGGFDDSDEVSDLHNLMPVKQEDCNAVRSNYPYGEVLNATSSYLETRLGTNQFNQTVYEPRDEFKGDAARAMMYHAAKNFTSAEDFSLPEQVSLVIPYGQNETVLKTWHFNDLPDNFERARNEYIETRQNNRNAFIDSVHYACYVRLSNMTKWQPIALYNGTQLTSVDQGISYQWFVDGEAIDGATEATFTPTSNGAYTVSMQQFEQCPAFTSVVADVTNVGVEEVEGNFSITAFPNPSNGRFQLNVNVMNPTNALVQITDLSGRIVVKEFRQLNAGQSTLQMPELRDAGVYMIEVTSEYGVQSARVVVE